MDITCIGLLVFFQCQVPSPPVPQARCPPLTQFSAADQRSIAAELRALPPGSPLAKFTSDAVTLRKRCRALEGK